MTEPTETTPALDVRHLTKAYPPQTVLQDVCFQIAPGERVGLMGPSGSGKSTLLNCLGGIDRPDSGEIQIQGQRIDPLDAAALATLRRSVIGSIFQFFHLLPTLSAHENVEFPLKLAGWSAAQRKERVSSLLQAVQLEHRGHALPTELSGGEMQRVAIARALAISPKILLADEPTGNLDSQTGERILDLLEELTQASQTALLLVTHSQDATRICHRTVHLKDGRLQTES